MSLSEMVAYTKRPRAAGPQIIFRRYTAAGTEVWRFKNIEPTTFEGIEVVFRVFNHEVAPAKLLPEVGILADYVDKEMGRLYREQGPICMSRLVRSSTTSPRDKAPPRRAEPAAPGPGLPTRSSPRRSSAPSDGTTTAGQLRLDV